jgi:dihydroorotate dehydrogenase
LNEELIRAMLNFIGEVSDFWTLNANCPNTRAGASKLTEPGALRSLLDKMVDQIGRANIPPLLIKQTIETNPELARQWIELALEYPFILGFSFNLPPGIPYELKTPKEKYQNLPGTLTGAPIRTRINQAMKIWSKELENTRLGLVVAGGVNSAETLYEKILLGASVTQIYTGLVYHGPGIVKSSLNGLLRLLEEDGFQNAQEAVGQWSEFPHRIAE